MQNISLIIILILKDEVDKYYDRYLPYHIEGGDVLNLK